MSGRRAAPDSEDADLLFLALRGRRVGHRLRGGGEGSWSGSGEGKRARAQRQRGGARSGERRARKQLYRGGVRTRAERTSSALAAAGSGAAVFFFNLIMVQSVKLAVRGLRRRAWFASRLNLDR